VVKENHPSASRSVDRYEEKKRKEKKNNRMPHKPTGRTTPTISQNRTPSGAATAAPKTSKSNSKGFGNNELYLFRFRHHTNPGQCRQVSEPQLKLSFPEGRGGK